MLWTIEERKFAQVRSFGDSVLTRQDAGEVEKTECLVLQNLGLKRGKNRTLNMI